MRLSRTLENVATEDPYNETHGIKVETRYQTGNPNSYRITSNPFRAATATAAGNEPTMGWTRSLSVNTGRHAEVETFSGAALPAPWGSNTASTGRVQTDIDSNATTVTDQAGKLRRSITNALGQLARVDEPNANNELGSVTSPNQPTYYSYDTLSNLINVSQGVQTRTFSCSSISRLLSATNPESGTINYSYDNNGNLTQKTDARNVTTTFSYDALNRATYRDYSDSTPDVTYSYDDSQVPFSKGKLTSVASSVSESRITAYDAQERITGSQQLTGGQTYSFSYTWDLADNLLTQTYPSGKVAQFDYDSSGDLARVGNSAGFTYASSFSYAPHGELERFRFGNGLWETQRFNSRRQITEIGVGYSAANTGVWKTNYEYGDWQGSTLDTTKNNGGLARQTISVPTIGAATGFTAIQSYTHDPLDRLKSATETIGGNQTWKQTFLYDRFGNRNLDTANTTILSSESSVAKVANPEILTSNNRFKADQDNDQQDDYLFDPSGNLTRNAVGLEFAFNAENLQTSATGSGLSMAYSYDGNNKRVKTYDAINDRTTIFVYDANGVLAAEYTINVTPPAVPVISYLTEDALGSVRVTTNSFAEVKARRDFLPFGEELYAGLAGRTTNQRYSSSTDDTRKKFATYQRDAETSLDFAQSRYYSPMHGRFTSPDEFKGGPDELFDFEDDASDNPTFYADLTNPQSLNKYQYGYNNPYKFNDPSGHCPLCWAIAEVVGTVADVAATVQVFRDPQASGTERFATVTGTVVGILAPGAGYGVAAKAITRKFRREATETIVKKTTTPAAQSITSATKPPRIPKSQRVGPIPKKVRRQKFEENRKANSGRLKCGYCPTEMVPAKKSQKGVTPPKNEATLDHVIPRSRGGSNDPANLKPACRKCNGEKSDND